MTANDCPLAREPIELFVTRLQEIVVPAKAGTQGFYSGFPQCGNDGIVGNLCQAHVGGCQCGLRCGRCLAIDDYYLRDDAAQAHIAAGILSTGAVSVRKTVMLELKCLLRSVAERPAGKFMDVDARR